jgi:hypothetical protein
MGSRIGLVGDRTGDEAWFMVKYYETYVRKEEFAMTFDEIRDIALSFPEVEEHEVFGGPTFRIRKRFLVCIAKIDPDTLCLKVPDQLERQFLLETQPDVYYLTPHYENFECLLVRMAAVHPEEIRHLLEKAWLTYAPKRLSKAYLESKGV